MVENPSRPTIATISAGLPDPIPYVRVILEKLWDSEKTHGNARVRIGAPEDGTPPNYRIEAGQDDSGGAVLQEAFNGRNHRKLTEKQIATAGAWSEETSALPEVRTLIGKLRNFTMKSDMVAKRRQDRGGRPQS